MSRRVLEINDVALTVADAGGVLARSPGQIICGDRARGGMLVGRAASEQRRINPRATHDRFWSILDQTPLPHPAGPARSNADLVWLHLRELLAFLRHRDDQDPDQSRGQAPWMIVVPAAYDDDQLGLLLGIAGNLDLDIERLVSAPVAAARAAAATGDSLVVDVHWHRFSADLVRRSGQAYFLEPDGTFEGRGPGAGGLGGLFDAWAGLVNNAFVAQTRFDPSHDAVVEQELYNRLPDWLAQLARGEDADALLDVGGQRYRADLSSDAFVSAAEPFYRVLADRVRQAGAGTLVLRHRLAGLPGLAERIAEAGCETTCWLDEHDVVRAALELPAAPEAAPDGAVPFTVRWSAGDQSREPRPDSAPEPQPERRSEPDGIAPSHVLVGGRALAIESSGRDLSEHWRIEREPDGRVALVGDAVDPAAPPAAINGAPAGERTAVKSGDRVSIGGHDYVLLRVEDNG